MERFKDNLFKPQCAKWNWFAEDFGSEREKYSKRINLKHG